MVSPSSPVDDTGAAPICLQTAGHQSAPGAGTAQLAGPNRAPMNARPLLCPVPTVPAEARQGGGLVLSTPPRLRSASAQRPPPPLPPTAHLTSHSATLLSVLPLTTRCLLVSMDVIMLAWALQLRKGKSTISLKQGGRLLAVRSGVGGLGAVQAAAPARPGPHASRESALTWRRRWRRARRTRPRAAASAGPTAACCPACRLRGQGAGAGWGEGRGSVAKSRFICGC